jgi:Tol biopolymer transport system component
MSSSMSSESRLHSILTSRSESGPGKILITLATSLALIGLALIGGPAYAPAGETALAQEQPPALRVIIDGGALSYPPPVIVNGRVLAPASYLANALGAQVSWDAGQRMATLTADGAIIKLYADSPRASLNGSPVDLDSPARILHDRIFAPVRFVAEGLGARVNWNEPAQAVEITSKEAADVNRVYNDALPARIAFTNLGHLWLLDAGAAGGQPQQVTTEGTAGIIGWSPDGQWLAYLLSDERGDASFSGSSRLWVVGADGTGAYRVDGDTVMSGQALAWSPADNTIAYLTETAGDSFAGFKMKLAHIAGGAAEIDTLLPEGSGAFDFGWAPDGRSLAVSFPANRERGLLIDRVALDGERTSLLQLDEKIDSYDYILYPWGAQGFKWSPDGSYLAYYARSMSASLSADGVSIQLLDVATGKTLDLGTGLKYPEWLAWSPDSKQLAFIDGGGREATKYKRLFIASMPDGQITDCSSAGQVDTQPVWTQTSPYRVAFCRGAENLDWEGRTDGYRGVMVPGQQIWLGDGSVRQPLTATSSDTAAYAPSISSDGKHLVYLHLDRMSVGSLYLAPLDGLLDGGAATRAGTRLLGGLTGSAGYYGNYYPAWFSIYWEQPEAE